MNEMMQEVKIEINKLEKMMLKIDDFLHNAPEGCLKWQRKGTKIYYYQQCKDHVLEEKPNSTGMKTNKNKWKRKYITKDNISLAKLLARKHYYITLKGMIQKQIKALRDFAKNCPDREIDAIYEELSEERKRLIDPIEPTLKDKVKQWCCTPLSLTFNGFDCLSRN